MTTKNVRRRFGASLFTIHYSLFLAVICVTAAACLGLGFMGAAPGPTVTPARGAVVSSPTITITTTAADTTATPTSNAHEAQISWVFGTVVGSYTTCTVQAKTSFDGSNYLTLGSAATVTATTGTVNAWTILAQGPTTSVTTSSVSSTAALGFGQLSKFSFACSGAYGTSAPVSKNFCLSANISPPRATRI
jgi:hypothetical protein